MTEKENIYQFLLTEVAEKRKNLEADWKKTGEKYNIFKVAGIAHKEVNICRFLADLLDPHGKHCQENCYLSLFWDTIKKKELPPELNLNLKKTKVTKELVIDGNRRIDITLEDDKIFIPIEVKIFAKDLPKQLADYYKFSKERNEEKGYKDNVPVFYLTVDGREPHDSSRDGIGKDTYVKISFEDDILDWLDACKQENTPETVRENLRQLIEAIKSFCGKTEDEEMENKIFELVTNDEKFVQAALDIKSYKWEEDFNKKALDAFKGSITELVQKQLPEYVVKFTPDDDWRMIQVRIKVMSGDYILDVNYDWKSLSIEIDIKKEDRNHKVEEEMKKEIKRHFTVLTIEENKSGNIEFQGRYPDFESENETMYFYKLWKLYTDHSNEMAEKIINIVRALESLKV